MTRDECKNTLLSMMKQVDDILTQADIPYSLCGGSMIGAVRHQGFIPWDDDIDIWIPYEYAEKVCQILRDKLPANLQFVEPKDISPHFWDFVVRVQDSRYLWHSETDEDKFYENKQNHVSIDIFWVIGCPNSFLLRKLFFLRQKLIYGLAMGHRYQIKDEKYSLIMKIQSKILCGIGKIIPMKKILSWQNKMCQKRAAFLEYPYCTTSNDIPSNMGCCHNTGDFMAIQKVPFENLKLPIFKGYDSILRRSYGDYMTPDRDENKYIKHMDFEE